MPFYKKNNIYVVHHPNIVFTQINQPRHKARVYKSHKLDISFCLVYIIISFPLKGCLGLNLDLPF